VLATTVIPANTAEQIRMPSALWTRTLDGAHGRAIWQIRLNDPYLVAMRVVAVDARIEAYSNDSTASRRQILLIVFCTYCMPLSLIPNLLFALHARFPVSTID